MVVSPIAPLLLTVIPIEDLVIKLIKAFMGQLVLPDLLPDIVHLGLTL